MREDMAKVIVERPRHGGGAKYPRGSVRHLDRVTIDEWPTREGIGRPWLGSPWEKGLNEHLSPLRRFLRSNVGRPWDKVYAEICRRIDRKSAVQLHVWQHLADYVCTDPHTIEGIVGHRFHGRLWHEFYVDPRTGLLREGDRLTKRQWRQIPPGEVGPRPRPAPNPVVPINDSRCYEQVDGVWYELDLRKPPASGRVVDGRTQCEVPFAPRLGFRHYRGRRLYVAVRRRLDAKEARRVGRDFRRAFEQELSGRV